MARAGERESGSPAAHRRTRTGRPRDPRRGRSWRAGRERRFRELLRAGRVPWRAEWIVAPVLASILLAFVLVTCGPHLMDALSRATGQDVSARALLLPLDHGRLAPVKRSLARGDLPPARLSEAKRFRWNGTETVGGPLAGVYETVTVSFDIETIFGVYPVDYKCLLRDGEVVAWIDPASELEQ